MNAEQEKLLTLVQEKNWIQLSTLLGAGLLDPNRKFNDGFGAFSLLSSAIGNGGSDFAVELIKGGAKVNAIEQGWSPLMLACQLKLHGVIEALVNAQADVNLKSPKHYEDQNGKYTALMLAAEQQDFWAVRRLIHAGADVNAVTLLGESALFWAESATGCHDGDLQIAKELIYAGTKFRGNELHLPILNRDVAMVKFFVGEGCDVNGRLQPFNRRFKGELCKDDTPLTVAVRQKTRELFGIEAGLRFDRKTLKMIPPPEEETLASLRKRRLEIIEFLLSKGANPNVVNAVGYSPLSYAVMQREVKIAKMLLAAKADPNFGGASVREKALTPSVMAKKKGLKKFIEMFG